MLKALKIATISTGAMLAILVWAATYSASYQVCETERAQTYLKAQNGDLLYDVAAFFVCEGVTLDDNAELVTAFATVILAIFTGTLWWSAIQQEKMARVHERAYVLYGGLYGEPVKQYRVDVSESARRNAKNYTDPWILQIHNFGRTPGFVTQVTWGVCLKAAFPADTSITEIIKKGVPKTEIAMHEVSISPTANYAAIPYRHVHPGRVVGQIFFGRIDYIDVFGTRHHSTWAVEHGVHASDNVGTFIATDRS